MNFSSNGLQCLYGFFKGFLLQTCNAIFFTPKGIIEFYLSTQFLILGSKYVGRATLDQTKSPCMSMMRLNPN